MTTVAGSRGPLPQLCMVQESDIFKLRRHGLLARDVMLGKLHKGHKWFDSGEYFLSKEGLTPTDQLPGGAALTTLEPKLHPTPASLSPRSPSTMSRPGLQLPPSSELKALQVSDY